MLKEIKFVIIFFESLKIIFNPKYFGILNDLFTKSFSFLPI